VFLARRPPSRQHYTRHQQPLWLLSAPAFPVPGPCAPPISAPNAERQPLVLLVFLVRPPRLSPPAPLRVLILGVHQCQPLCTSATLPSGRQPDLRFPRQLFPGASALKQSLLFTRQPQRPVPRVRARHSLLLMSATCNRAISRQPSASFPSVSATLRVLILGVRRCQPLSSCYACQPLCLLLVASAFRVSSSPIGVSALKYSLLFT
jgi:hypothetical protein